MLKAKTTYTGEAAQFKIRKPAGRRHEKDRILAFVHSYDEQPEKTKKPSEPGWKLWNEQ